MEKVTNAFTTNKRSNLSTDQLDQFFCLTTFDSNQALWLEWHDKLGHPPDRELQAFVHSSIIPKAVLISKNPIYSLCLFGEIYKRPWRTKGKSKIGIRKV